MFNPYQLHNLERLHSFFPLTGCSPAEEVLTPSNNCRRGILDGMDLKELLSQQHYTDISLYRREPILCCFFLLPYGSTVSVN